MPMDAPLETTSTNRVIHTRSVAREVPRLLQSLFASELVAPSRHLWLVSPWISNIPILDNRTNTFRHVEPNWPQAYIRLTDVLAKLLMEGTTVHVATRPSRRGKASKANDIFVRELKRKASGEDAPLYVNRRREDKLHQKGLLTEAFYLRGSMNFTRNGIQHNDERVEFTTDKEEIARARSEFKEQWNTAQSQ